jgi:hypothetical protein
MTNLASVNDIPEALPTEWRFPLPHYYAKLIATARDCRYTDPLKPYGQDPRPPAPGQIRDSARWMANAVSCRCPVDLSSRSRSWIEHRVGVQFSGAL